MIQISASVDECDAQANVLICDVDTFFVQLNDKHVPSLRVQLTGPAVDSQCLLN